MVIPAFTALQVFTVKWKKINLDAEKWYGKQQCLPLGIKNWAGDYPIGPTANGPGWQKGRRAS